MTLPIGEEDDFIGIVDLLTKKAWIWDDSGNPESYKIEEVPADLIPKVEEYREKLIETALEQDDEAMMAYLEEGEEPSIDVLKACIRKGTINLDFFPTFCGSAFKNKGIQPVLNAVVDFLPNPTEVKPQPEIDLEGNETGDFATVDPEKPLRALAFKIMDDRFGALTFTRIYSGNLKKGDFFVCGNTWGNIRAMIDINGKINDEANPSTPVEILGMNESANAGDEFSVVESEEEAKKSEINDPNALALATVGKNGIPSVRMVLLKEFDENGFVFYTNLDSVKSNAIKENSNISMCFHWKSLLRQIRIVGTAEKVSDDEADSYYNSRSYGSRIGAWASNQSSILKDREELNQSIKKFKDLYKDENNVPRPDHWSGWRLKHHEIEFWLDGENRIHERLKYKFEQNKWDKFLLSP